jgi:hypothetical protein
MHAVCHHVGNEEGLAVRRGPHVLRHAGRRADLVAGLARIRNPCRLLAGLARSAPAHPGDAKYWLSARVPTTERFTRSILVTAPENSQVNSANRPSIEKSAWLMPAHRGTGIENFSAIVATSRKSSRL